MKNVTRIYFLAFALIAVSCANDSKNGLSSVEDDQLKIKNFDQIGIVHNNGLDFIFSEKILSKLKTFNKEKNSVDSIAIASLIVSEANNFLENQVLELGNITVALQPVEDVSDFLQVYENSNLGIYADCSGEPHEVLACIDNIMNDYLTNPDREDYNIVMSTGALYKYSVAYWSNEENRTADFKDLQQKGWFSWTAFAIADVQGAWGGAQIGAATGTQVGVAAGAVAFGLMSSAYNAAIQAAVHEAQQ